MTEKAVLLLTVALLCVYVVGVGGSTAAALRSREAWRRRRVPAAELEADEVALLAPSLPAALRWARVFGWMAFVPALVLGVIANPHYQWVAPLTVIVMVALNAFYFSSTQGLGESLTLSADGFRLGKRTVRWVHVSELAGAHIGTYRAMTAPDAGEWQDPKTRPNAVVYRLNRALVDPRKSLLQRWSGLAYYDGIVRNAFGVPTEALLRSMVDRRQRALAAQDPALRHILGGGVTVRPNRGA